MLSDIIKASAKPSNQFRGAPFWAWNSKLDPAELRRQIRIFKEMGFGGFFMHARVGLDTPYLEKEWFECVNACVDEAKKLKMNAWLYDEDRWPSGSAGGKVTKEVKYRVCQLCYARVSSPADLTCDPDKILCIFSIKRCADGITIDSLKPLKAVPAKAPKGQEVVVFYWQRGIPTPWHNGQTYLDTMDPEAVKRFIEITHEAYAKNCSQEFGKVIPGIFTDEPSYANSETWLAWTPKFPEHFKKTYGYDLIPHLPELFFNLKDGEFSKARHDFYEMACSLFDQNYAKQIADWCEKHGIALTGHILGEDSLNLQRARNGACMRFYEYEQIPGIDLLTQYWDIIDVAKQCSSAARQFDRPMRLCECYGTTGWDFPLSGHKALGDWLAVLGINFRVPHLAWYSMKAEAKRDYPASISFQSSWYKNYSVVEDYFARLQAALYSGREVRDILVIHPIETTWASKANPLAQELYEAKERASVDAMQIDLRNILVSAHLDFDYGDELLMKKYAKVAGKTLKVGAADYRAVVIPELTTIRSTTLQLLTDFAAAGGKVLYFGAPPAHLDCLPSQEPAKAYAAFESLKELAEVVPALTRRYRRVSFTAKKRGHELPSVMYMLKNNDDCETLFVVNTGMEHPAEQMKAPRVEERCIECPSVNVSFKSEMGADAKVYELDLTDGSWNCIPATNSKGVISFKTSMAPLESKLYVFTAKPMPSAKPAPEPFVPFNGCELPACCWEYELSEPNCMVFDQAQLKIDGQFEDEDVRLMVRIDNELRKRLGAPNRGGAMCQPWTRSKKQKPAKTIDTELIFTFDCEVLPAAEEPLALAIENPELYEIAFNGTVLKQKDLGEWVDPCLRKIEVPISLLKLGLNTISLKLQYHEFLPGLENVFLLGKFGVKGSRTMIALPDELCLGDLAEQGLPNYSSKLTYKMEVGLDAEALKGRLMLAFGDWKGAALGVSVNGSPMKMIAWPPYQLEVTDLLKKGKNHIEIALFCSRRNAFGPFYTQEPFPQWVNSGCLMAHQISERRIVPCGIMTPPMLLTDC